MVAGAAGLPEGLPSGRLSLALLRHVRDVIDESGVGMPLPRAKIGFSELLQIMWRLGAIGVGETIVSAFVRHDCTDAGGHNVLAVHS